MKITNITKRETNPFFNPAKAFDGGGYSQPEITLTLSEGGQIVISDTSCGAFGARYSAEYTDADGNQKARYVFDGTVPFGGEIYEYGNFNQFPEIAEAVKTATGYNLLVNPPYGDG